MYRDLELYIDGTWRGASNGATRAVTDPATEDTLGSIAAATEADIDAALTAARAGFSVWRRVGTWERAKLIRKASDLIRERADEIATLMSVETGKPLAEAKGEVNAAADQFEWYSEETKRIYGQIIESRTADSRMAVIHQPVGVVAAFSAWNFPALLPARKIAAALAAGCSIIIKPAGEAPASCAALVRACHDAGVPSGVVNFLTGQSDMIARRLIASPIVRKVSLTGSVPVGKQILHLAADGVKKVSMELGGHAPVVVFDDVDAEKAAEVCANTKFRNCGQVCISPTRFYVHESKYEAFARRFAEVAKSLKVGRGMEEGVQMGPLANRRGLETIQELVEDARQRGAEVLAGGSVPAEANRGFFFEPTVLGHVPDDARIMREEPFGPVAPLTTFTSYDEVMERANALPFGLAGYVFSNDLRTATRAYEDLEVGMVGVNEMLLATAEAPFGGVKESGMGREGGSFGIGDYLETKYVKIKLEERAR
ncbi:NAD-dependent succinate-semialdehyde dehydrogenase [Aurantimonas sp. C2-6-R+9]|uniref:NAD-dependent succinate-semialdehyde dehydrogenase n=1 Tax=unclassified Aurantimonas TaxID=2638230 RepID=UPI002E19F143|nr:MULTISPECIES: NAD-dependent succinate-semialdehyde dehydrogenase [unclassified Aurantimonas]MEC5291142.1 NAD-dependent succinate-semialdehyde dehydrogenase [Aurantimonas sp. C2-3-R2]MEC5381469.1 NAD-dependent succinate-semialdehyde dehydrogenase [Aurantimonas sp. C2-6-R+9]MEC5411896.1 NAD-dependent succinate-semialdehyde dehydrogenase [Aurantimonas sp. C2-4-R8]